MPLHRDNAHPRNLNLPPVLFALTELCIFDIDDIDVTLYVPGSVCII